MGLQLRLCNTGAAKTLISEDLALKLQVPVNPLEEGEMSMLFTADGTAMPLYAKTTLCICLLYTSPSPRDGLLSRMPSSA